MIGSILTGLVDKTIKLHLANAKIDYKDIDVEAIIRRFANAKISLENTNFKGSNTNFKGSGSCVALSEKEAVEFFRRAAEQGNAIAQIILGLIYVEGCGVEQSDAEAVKWYRMAAEQGNALAQYNLGFMYDKGRGVEQSDPEASDTEAVNWYCKAAEQGIAAAQNNLGLMYDKGRGVEQSDIEAVKWYRMAAEQGNAVAQDNLGDMYKDARGVEQSNFEAVKWYRKAAEQGNKHAELQLKSMHFSLNDKPYTDCEEGEHFFLGSYPQGKNGAVKPLEWRILEKSNDRLLVIAEYGLDAKAYNEKRVNAWLECTLRSWLNGEFMEKAFTDEEQGLIEKRKIDFFNPLLGNTSIYEKVFLLSTQEVNQYFSKEKRCCKPTAYAVEQGVLASDNAEYTGNCWWWLSSPGLNDSSAASVYGDGDVSSNRVTDPTGAVRPAMYLTRSRK